MQVFLCPLSNRSVPSAYIYSIQLNVSKTELDLKLGLELIFLSNFRHFRHFEF
jgi:hypothetical protein